MTPPKKIEDHILRTPVLNPLSEFLIPSEARGIHLVGALVRTHRNTMKEKWYASPG
jgi:hypothetical protein